MHLCMVYMITRYFSLLAFSLVGANLLRTMASGSPVTVLSATPVPCTPDCSSDQSFGRLQQVYVVGI